MPFEPRTFLMRPAYLHNMAVPRQSSELCIVLVDRESVLVEPLQRDFANWRLIVRAAPAPGEPLPDFGPGVVIVDADLPDSVEFLASLRASDQPVIAIGLTDSPETHTRLQALGVETIIHKRLGPQPVLEALRSYLEPESDDAEEGSSVEVLIVDDEKDFQFLVSNMLHSWGYSPIVADDGETALEIMDRRPGIAAVLLDLRLPGRGGMEILKELRRKQPQTGVIMVTGVSDREIAQQASKLGAFDYVTKPPDFASLQFTIDACVSQSEYQSKSWWKRFLR